jgi:hypothetical protein
MTPRTFFLYARVAVVAAVCGLLASARYSLSNIFVGRFSTANEVPLVDGRLLLLMIAGVAICLGALEFFRFVFGWKERASRRNPLRILARERIRPKFGF